jgi:hypothetical protein
VLVRCTVSDSNGSFQIEAQHPKRSGRLVAAQGAAGGALPPAGTLY